MSNVPDRRTSTFDCDHLCLSPFASRSLSVSSRLIRHHLSANFLAFNIHDKGFFRVSVSAMHDETRGESRY